MLHHCIRGMKKVTIRAARPALLALFAACLLLITALPHQMKIL